MNGHVIGMNISPDKNFLYVNVRGWPENAIPSQDQAPPINQNIELRTIDLRTLELQPQVAFDIQITRKLNTRYL